MHVGHARGKIPGPHMGRRKLQTVQCVDPEQGDRSRPSPTRQVTSATAIAHAAVVVGHTPPSRRLAPERAKAYTSLLTMAMDRISGVDRNAMTAAWTDSGRSSHK